MVRGEGGGGVGEEVVAGREGLAERVRGEQGEQDLGEQAGI